MKLNGARFKELARVQYNRTGSLFLLRSDGQILRKRLCGDWQKWKRFKDRTLSVTDMLEQFGSMFADREKYTPNVKRQVISRKALMSAMHDYRNEHTGFCVLCGSDRSGCEPDAREYRCESCGNDSVYGATEIFMTGAGRLRAKHWDMLHPKAVTDDR